MMNFGGNKPMSVSQTASLLGVPVDLVRRSVRDFADRGKPLGRASHQEGHWQRRLMQADRIKVAAYIVAISK